MLHIHNGDVTANTARGSSLPGEHFVFREALIDGPNPSGLSPLEWRKTRAQHLSKTYATELDQLEHEMLEQDEKLASFSEHEEVVLWFEHDLFCQTHLSYLLNWFGRRQLGHTRLSLICIGEFPGKKNFRGLGELNAEELASLFPTRQFVTNQQLELASSAWEAYCSANPKDIESFLAKDSSSLQFLGPALKAHLKRFPSTTNGLGQIENRGLELVNAGTKRFVDLFSRFVDLESVYGLGDLQFWEALRRISDARQPLITRKDHEGATEAIAPDVLHKAKFEITDLGRTVLRGDADFIQLNGIDLWLGGVHLNGNTSAWKWDDASQKLISS